jgi:hypothetical protein
MCGATLSWRYFETRRTERAWSRETFNSAERALFLFGVNDAGVLEEIFDEGFHLADALLHEISVAGGLFIPFKFAQAQRRG